MPQDNKQELEQLNSQVQELTAENTQLKAQLKRTSQESKQLVKEKEKEKGAPLPVVSACHAPLRLRLRLRSSFFVLRCRLHSIAVPSCVAVLDQKARALTKKVGEMENEIAKQRDMEKYTWAPLARQCFARGGR